MNEKEAGQQMTCLLFSATFQGAPGGAGFSALVFEIPDVHVYRVF